MRFSNEQQPLRVQEFSDFLEQYVHNGGSTYVDYIELTQHGDPGQALLRRFPIQDAFNWDGDAATNDDGPHGSGNVGIHIMSQADAPATAQSVLADLHAIIRHAHNGENARGGEKVLKPYSENDEIRPNISLPRTVTAYEDQSNVVFLIGCGNNMNPDYAVNRAELALDYVRQSLRVLNDVIQDFLPADLQAGDWTSAAML